MDEPEIKFEGFRVEGDKAVGRAVMRVPQEYIEHGARVLKRHLEQERLGRQEEERGRFERFLQESLNSAGYASFDEYVRASAEEDRKWREEKEEREITDLDELLEILTGREVMEAEEANGYHLDTGFSVSFYGDREKGVPFDHLVIWPVEENGIARLSIKLARTKWTRIEEK